MATNRKADGAKWAKEGRTRPAGLLVDPRSDVPKIHESTQPGMYTNVVGTGIAYTPEFTMHMSAAVERSREVLVRDYITAEEMRALLGWADVTKVYRGLRHGDIPSRRRKGETDKAWQIPIHGALAYLLQCGYLPDEIEAARKRCEEWARTAAHTKAG